MLLPVSLLAGGKPELDEDEKLEKEFSGVKAWVGDNEKGEGTLYVGTENMYFVPSSAPSKGFAVHWTTIMMHAISRDMQAFSYPCIYCQLDFGESDEAIERASSSDIRLVFGDADVLGVVFEIFSECQARFPSQADEGEGEFFFNSEEAELGAGSDARDAAMAKWEAALERGADNAGGQGGEFDDAAE